MRKKIRFKSDEFTICGVLHLPAIKHPPVVIGSHGLMSSGDSPKQVALAQSCVENGIAFFRFDHRGCGNSSGDFASATTFEGRCRDLIDAVLTMMDHPDTGSRIAMFGSSFGGAVSIAVSRLFQTNALVTVAAPVRLASIRPPDATDPADQNRLASLDRARLDFDVSGWLKEISNILIFHGDADAVVPFSDALEIYRKTKSPKQLIRLEGGDHPMGNPLHRKQFIRLAVAWFKRGFHPVDDALTDKES
jgi:alpha-beta hydrolase superfamily lysophospholipase